jgi:hypothetical protein
MDINSRYMGVRPGVLCIKTAGIWMLGQVFYGQ